MKIGYYAIFDIDHTASQAEIKKAFHKLAHRYHPDKPGGDPERFKAVYAMYQVLSNVSERSFYDLSIKFQMNPTAIAVTMEDKLRKEGYSVVPDVNPPGYDNHGRPWGSWYTDERFASY